MLRAWAQSAPVAYGAADRRARNQTPNVRRPPSLPAPGVEKRSQNSEADTSLLTTFLAVRQASRLDDDLLEISKRREVLVGERLIQNGPEVLGGLKLRRVPGQVNERDPVRHDQVGR